jgi:hypothetical protein
MSEEAKMGNPGQLIVVQRHQETLYKTLRHANRGAAEVIFDRRQGERRRGGGVARAGVERRQTDRRRALTSDERARWTELRYLARPIG